MGLRTRLIDWRNRLISNPDFQEWTAGFFLTRPIAKRRARAAFDLAAGFVYSQILRACVETGLLVQMRQGAYTLDELLEKVALPKEGATRLINAAASLKLVERVGADRYMLGEVGAAFLGNPSVFAMIHHNGLFYQDLVDPVALLKERTGDTALASFWRYATSDDPAASQASDVSEYSRLMAETQGFIAKDVLDACSLKGVTTLMDVGGGEGAFLAAALARYPDLNGILCDLPAVAERAAARFDRDGFAQRAIAQGRNIFVNDLPAGADAISLVRVLHDHDDESIIPLLDKIHGSLPQNGRLIIAEPMADIPGAEPVGDAYFGLYLWAMGSGRPRSPHEICRLLKAAGFVRCNIIATRRPMLCNLVIAERK